MMCSSRMLAASNAASESKPPSPTPISSRATRLQAQVIRNQRYSFQVYNSGGGNHRCQTFHTALQRDARHMPSELPQTARRCARLRHGLIVGLALRESLPRRRPPAGRSSQHGHWSVGGGYDLGCSREKRPDCVHVHENPVLCMHEFIQNSATRFIPCNFTRISNTTRLRTAAAAE
eukprot:COSAG01_NODE_24488_length_777_cov_0.912979_2_plen_175_part_01